MRVPPFEDELIEDFIICKLVAVFRLYRHNLNSKGRPAADDGTRVDFAVLTGRAEPVI